MNYLTSKQLSQKWGIGQCRIIRLAREGRIEGAKKYGKSWLFPETAEKPSDARTRQAKPEINKEFFRFPLYINSSEDGFEPPLSGEERMLRQAELDFFACDFPKAEEELLFLWHTSKTIYVKTMSVFLLCWLSVVNNCGDDYDGYFLELELALAEDFLNKKEMELLRPWLYMYLTQYDKAAESFTVDLNYNYSPTVYPLMTYLAYMDKNSIEHPEVCAMRSDIYEIETMQLEYGGHVLEAQILHLTLFVFYFMSANNEKMLFHLKNAIEIAYKYNFILYVADAYPFYTDTFNSVLSAYPEEFAIKVKQCGELISSSFSTFSLKHSVNDLFVLLSNNDIKYILYAVQGYSNKRVAGIINTSERTVANRYAAIYNKLNVNGKQGLLEAIKILTAHNHPFSR